MLSIYQQCFSIKYKKRNREILLCLLSLSSKGFLTGEWYKTFPIYYRMTEDFPLKS